MPAFLAASTLVSELPWLWLLIIPVTAAVGLFQLSLFGGWRRLAQSYPANLAEWKAILKHSQYIGHWTMVSASVGWVGYNNCLIITATQSGLWMRPWGIFSLGHRPLHIPWSAMRDISTSGWFQKWRGSRFEIETQSGITRLTLPKKVAANRPDKPI